VLLAFSVTCIIWMLVTVGGLVWLAPTSRRHSLDLVALQRPAGRLVLAGIAALLPASDRMRSCRRADPAHRAGRVGNGTESMFAYGRRIVIEHFAR